jgi:hypothetical protein
MNKQPPAETDTYSEEETVARREAALKRMLATLPEAPEERRRKNGEISSGL